MTATARVASTTAASVAYTASIAAGAVGNFSAIGVMSPTDGTEKITFESSNGAADTWQVITYVDGNGDSRPAELNARNNSVLIQGPVDFRINKTATAIAVEVTQYT